MSLIHLEKSVLTFHLKEILEDGHGTHPLTWLSLGLLVLGPKLLPSGDRKARSVSPSRLHPNRSSGHTSRSLSQWVAEAKQRELELQLHRAMPSQTALSFETSHRTPDSLLRN